MATGLPRWSVDHPGACTGSGRERPQGSLVRTGTRAHLCACQGTQSVLLVTHLLLCTFLSTLEVQRSGLGTGLLQVTVL